MLFKPEHIGKILKGEKTQTRRIGKLKYKVGRRYRIQRSWYDWTDIQILITRRFRQRLGDITHEEAKKEGYHSVEEFGKAWEQIYGPGSWNPNKIVTVYELKLVE